ncbi:MAG: hypothetical protein JXB32_25965 [Deltaproteobacteria bacterium]|nr:hypothetical protein [Deltaproteobacteria bacterium]
MKIEDLLPETWRHFLPDVRRTGRRMASLVGREPRDGIQTAEGYLYECWQTHPDWSDKSQVVKFVKDGIEGEWGRPRGYVPYDEGELASGGAAGGTAPRAPTRSDARLRAMLEGAIGTDKRADTAGEPMLDRREERDEVDSVLAALEGGDRPVLDLVAKIKKAHEQKKLTPERRARFKKLIDRLLEDASRRPIIRARPREAFRDAPPGYIQARLSFVYHDRIARVRERLCVFYDVVRRFFPTPQALTRLVRRLRASAAKEGRRPVGALPLHETDAAMTAALLRMLARGQRVRWPKPATLPARTVLLVAAVAGDRLSLLPKGALWARTQFELAALLGSTGRLPRRSSPGLVLAKRGRAVLTHLPAAAIGPATIVELANLVQPPRFVAVEPPESGRPPKGGGRVQRVVVRHIVSVCAGRALDAVSGEETKADDPVWAALEWAQRVRTALRAAAGGEVAEGQPDLLQLASNETQRQQRALDLKSLEPPLEDVKLDLLDPSLTKVLYEPKTGAVLAAASACALIFDRSASECRKAQFLHDRHGDEIRRHATHPVGSALLPFAPRPRRRS